MSDENNEMADIHRRFNALLAAALSGVGQLAALAMEYYAERLRRAALARQEEAAAERAMVAARHRADREVWNQTRRPEWWRTASAEDIAQAWRAANTWAGVDPRAREARDRMREELRRRGVEVDQPAARPEDELWVRTALDLAVAEARVEERVDELDAVQETEDQFEHTDVDRARMAEHVRGAWSAGRADLVVDQEAWGALAYTMHRLERRGHDVPGMLRGLPDVSNARTPAALTVWLLENSTNAAADEQARADAQRNVERDERTIEGDWQEAEEEAPPATVRRVGAAEQADIAYGQAETAAARAGAHEDGAANLAATAAIAYPTSTGTAVAQSRVGRRTGAAANAHPATKASARGRRARSGAEQDR